MRDRGRGRIFGLAAASVLIAVALTVAVAIGGRSASSPPVVPVQYRLAVDDAGVEAGPDGWTVTNDLGFEITVERYVVSTWSATAQACDDEERAMAWPSLLSVTSASASHSEPPDPAQGNGPTRQLLEPDEPTIDFDTATVTADAVCRTHVAVAGGEGTSTGRTEPTIEVDGSSRSPDADEVVEFTSAPVQGWGGIVEVDAVALTGAGADIVVVRQLAHLFDGVDFAADPDDLDTALLQGLTAATTIEVMAPTG